MPISVTPTASADLKCLSFPVSRTDLVRPETKTVHDATLSFSRSPNTVSCRNKLAQSRGPNAPCLCHQPGETARSARGLAWPFRNERKLTRQLLISFSSPLGLHTEFDHWTIRLSGDGRVAATAAAFAFGVFGTESRGKSHARENEQDTSERDDD